MARIAGVSIPEQKKIKISLSYLYGIGKNNALAILKQLNMDPEKRVKDITEQEINLLRETVEKNYRVEGKLRQVVGLDIKRLKEINSYRGVRHKLGLPVHGQRTKTNARTKRGKRMNVGSGKKKAEK
ncbi:30S ribosomal protein S13 [Candidatus Wirthbacteria bacterium CG2_30_54_11]|uniref:Small ribosomal subunit protein uS13 n=1 Tax=Candidatus Wirthbacteria bacterium CG2_30_54_11 TaxID=1817892 RepID=A0A1J5IXL6_9BACT|nr:MAG: 30S ribosomal protein S13 [Candidatus Wirthbacteria bacterium CG2_30_54_11]